MRKLVYVINLTIDGCLDHTNQTVSKELLEFHTNLLREADTIVYGRITYQLMVPYWPDIAKDHTGQTKEDVEFAQAFEVIHKVVFSKSLADVDDKMTSVVRTDLADGILTLKQAPGKDILVGGVDIPSQLIALGLVDAFLFVVSPIIAGGGRRLLEGIPLPEGVQLTLVDSTILPSGHVALRYVIRWS
jgi:dihydrofolate reductase